VAERLVCRPIAYDEWTRPRLRNFREQCCDCGLIHRLNFRIVDGRIEFRTRRDERATDAARLNPISSGADADRAAPPAPTSARRPSWRYVGGTFQP
jgi:hypothetical protein